MRKGLLVLAMLSAAGVAAQQPGMSPEKEARFNTLIERRVKTNFLALYTDDEMTMSASYDPTRLVKLGERDWRLWIRWDFVDTGRNLSDSWVRLQNIHCGASGERYETIRAVSYRDGKVEEDFVADKPKMVVTDLETHEGVFYNALCTMLPHEKPGMKPGKVSGVDLLMLTDEETSRFTDLNNRVNPQRWKLLSFNRSFESATSYDKQTVASVGPSKWRAWFRWDKVADTSGVHHTLEQLLVDCSRMTTSSLAWSTYDKNGQVKSSGTTADKDIKPEAVIPDSVGEAVYTSFCKAMPKPKAGT